MVAIGKWSSTTLTTVMSTELNSAGNNSPFKSSSAFSNNTGLAIYADLEIVLNTLTPAGFPHINIYVQEAVDGTNYPGQTGGEIRLTIQHLIAKIPMSATAATAQRVVFRHAVIPPGTFFWIFENQMGVNMNAAGNTLRALTYNVNLNG